VPLPPGSGSGAYRAAFDRVVAPALDTFQPQLILVSSGFDASFRDPLSAQMCGSHDYRCVGVLLGLCGEVGRFRLQYPGCAVVRQPRS
jgi:acetoin utilization deacetylase AcuC-like enzyme